MYIWMCVSLCSSVQLSIVFWVLVSLKNKFSPKQTWNISCRQMFSINCFGNYPIFETCIYLLHFPCDYRLHVLCSSWRPGHLHRNILLPLQHMVKLLFLWIPIISFVLLFLDSRVSAGPAMFQNDPLLIFPILPTYILSIPP